MNVLDPGHVYRLSTLDAPPKPVADSTEDPAIHAQDVYAYDYHNEGVDQTLTFVKRVGDNYPGNSNPFPGTISQDVIRVLIHRLKFVNGQIPHKFNDSALKSLESALWDLEARAAVIRDLMDYLPKDHQAIYGAPVCAHCGHVVCLVSGAGLPTMVGIDCDCGEAHQALEKQLMPASRVDRGEGRTLFRWWCSTEGKEKQVEQDDGRSRQEPYKVG